MSAIKQLGVTLLNAVKNGTLRELRRWIIGAVTAVALWVASLFLPSDPPPAPEGAVLPKKRPVATASAAGAAPQAAAKPGDKAATPAGKAADKAAPKGSDKTPAKPADAAKTVAVPSKPAAVAAKPAPATPTPAAKPATPAAGAKSAAPANPVPAAVATAAKSAAASQPAATPTQTVSTPRAAESAEPTAGVTIQREVYAYDGTRRRDPFVSLAKPADVGPLLNELRLVGIAFDEVGRNSVAVLRDNQKGLYRVKTGQSIGRARVSSIGRRSVTFSIDEFGATRQEVIALADTTKRGS